MLITLAVVAASGCGGHTVAPAPGIASGAGDRAIAKYDTNGDKALDYDELAKAPGLRAAIATIKKFGDPRRGPPSESQLRGAKITAADIDARIAEWKSRGMGRMAVSCRVTKKGTSEPIANAEVKFVPEEFLGPGLATGTGTTDAQGTAKISQPSRGKGDADAGMFPGFYRVEITKGTEVPAKYNTATVLGEEVARDNARISRGGAVIELSY
jgi:hypothetical protein